MGPRFESGEHESVTRKVSAFLSELYGQMGSLNTYFVKLKTAKSVISHIWYFRIWSRSDARKV